MTAQGSAWKGYSIGPPSTVQGTFDSQYNAWLSYTGWGVYTPSIITSPVSKVTTGTNDTYGQPIVAYKFQTAQVPNTVLPPATFAWYIWLVSTAVTNGQQYSTIQEGVNPATMTDFNMTTSYSNLIVNYSGSTIPAGTYKVYSTYGNTSFRIQNLGNNLYFRGGTLI